MKVLDGELTFEGNTEFGDYHFRLELAEDNLEQIEYLQSKVKELGVYEITFFHNCLVINEGDSTEEERVEFCIVHVQESFIRVTGVLKHGCYTFSTGIISLEELEEE